jgi:hypothetical protein
MAGIFKAYDIRSWWFNLRSWGRSAGPILWPSFETGLPEGAANGD